MPTFLKGELFDLYGKVDLFCVTTCSYIKVDGNLAMGRGSALQLLQQEPDINRRAAVLLGNKQKSLYGLLFMQYPKQLIGLFQTKFHPYYDSSFACIDKATTMLSKWATDNPTKVAVMPFPGIGNGRLEKADVVVLIKNLPNNVHIYEPVPKPEDIIAEEEHEW